MKPKYLLLLIAFFLTVIAHAQNTFPSTGSAGIGTLTPDASSALEIKSNTQGLLIPRMTRVKRDAIAAPVEGLMIYQTTGTPGFYYYDGTLWVPVTPKNNGWLLTGNAGTDTALNFIGTTDAMPLVFKVNNQKAGVLDLNNANTAFGYNSLYLNTTGQYNTAIGYHALYSNIGTPGIQPIVSITGNENTATGAYSLNSNTGSNNTANGYYSLGSNTTGDGNTAIGASSLALNTTGGDNTAMGINSLYANKTGGGNTAMGDYSLYSNTTGSLNTAIGNSSLLSNKTGNDNTANGVGALRADTTGYSNVAIGSHALYNNGYNSNIVAVGDSALYHNGIGAVQGTTEANANSAVGSKALFNNTTGRANSAFGLQASYMNTTGYHNTSCGYVSLYHNLTGNNNTTLGYGADVATGALSNSVAIGSGASVSLSNCIMLGNAAVTKLGIGVTPSSANIIQFSVTTAKLTTGGVWTNASDKKLKNNFQKVDKKDILDKINQLDIERWHYIADGSPVTHIGPVAQDFYEAFKVGDDTTISTIDPAGVALLGIQQLATNEIAKDKKIDALQKEVDELKAMITSLQQDYSNCSPCAAENILSQQPSKITITTADASLDQNIPNPFSNATTIHYTLPLQFSSAQIIITGQNGKVLKQVTVNGSGKGTLNVEASTLSSGAYSYSLIVDGKLIDTKKMVLAK